MKFYDIKKDGNRRKLCGVILKTGDLNKIRQYLCVVITLHVYTILNH